MKAVPAIREPESASLHHALHGLALPAGVLRALQRRGIYCTPGISLEHQHLAKRYVLRGVESGGAVSDMGRACAFVSLDGDPLPWLQSLDSIAVNGRHAIFLAESMVRVEILRTVRTCELAVTLHTLSHAPGSIRPEVASTVLFRRRDGVLPLDLWKEEHRALRGKLTPIFYSRAGEILPTPPPFEDAIRKVAAIVCCIGCNHTHVGVPPVAGRRIETMRHPIKAAITVGEPNWAPLELALPACELENFMYMGRAGEIELYKHWLTRRYLNISANGQRFYRYSDGTYVEVTKAVALDHVRSRDQ